MQTDRHSFNLQPTLRGALVTLRPLRAEDFESLRSVAADPLIWEQHPEPDRYQDGAFRQFFQGALDSGGAFLVLDNVNGSVIGSSRYHRLDLEQSEVEIGWTFLARTHWGGRYNGEAKELMLTQAFRFVDSVLSRRSPLS